MKRTVSIVAALCALCYFGGASAASASSEAITAANSSFAWIYSNAGTVDAGAKHGNDCAEPAGKGEFACETEYDYVRSNGRLGSRWFFVTGYVSWTGIHVNPYGPGLVGTPHSHVYRPVSWIRAWHSDSCPGVLGILVSNLPCGNAEDFLQQGTAKVGIVPGKSATYWPWLTRYVCKSIGNLTTCSNKVGDAYRYRGADLYAIPRTRCSSRFHSRLEVGGASCAKAVAVEQRWIQLRPCAIGDSYGNALRSSCVVNGLACAANLGYEPGSEQFGEEVPLVNCRRNGVSVAFSFSGP
jgi:hypothetical protein